MLVNDFWTVGASTPPADLGGKASALAALPPDVPVPPFAVLRPGAFDAAGRLRPPARDALTAFLGAAPGHAYAVRSSAQGEDAAAASHAGQYRTVLGVSASDVPDAAEAVVASARSERARAYRAAVAGDDAPAAMAVIVQHMVEPAAAGVAFSADPATGRRRVAVVAAVAGRGDALVDGRDDGHTLRVDAAGAVVAEEGAPVLSHRDAARIAALARRLEAHFGPAQDVEWALAADGTLYALQSRPVTALAALADPDARVRLWDNANVAESYRGRVSPLTFSFARTAYAHVYRSWLRQMGVPDAALAAHAEAFRRLIGYVEGHVHYHLPSWYELLGLLPGIGASKGFMETMMGVREALPEGVLPPPAAGGWGARLRLVGTGVRLAWTFATMETRARRFLAFVDRSLALPDLGPMPFDAVVAQYRRLEDTLLPAWGTPLANDVATMVSFGLTRSLAARWAPYAAGLAEALATPGADVVSAAPAKAAAAMADAVRAHGGEALARTLLDAPPGEALAALRAVPAAAAAFDAALARFSDRCLDELKLESPTLDDDPTPLVRTVGALAARPAAVPPAAPLPAERLRAALPGAPLRRWLLGRVAAWARASVRRREALRFERTRVFGTARRLLRTAAARLAADGRLDRADDVFWLDVADLLTLADGTATTHDLRGLVALRRAERARWDARPAPPERFTTHGPLGFGPFVPTASASAADRAATTGGDVRVGLGAAPGVVEGPARVVVEPRGVALAPGDLLVAARTDPGWVTLFAAASGLVVERGSLLSHAAIVARELGLPTVVGVAGATAWAQSGDRLRLDGTTGRVERLRAAADAAPPSASSPTP